MTGLKIIRTLIACIFVFAQVSWAGHVQDTLAPKSRFDTETSVEASKSLTSTKPDQGDKLTSQGRKDVTDHSTQILYSGYRMLVADEFASHGLADDELLLYYYHEFAAILCAVPNHIRRQKLMLELFTVILPGTLMVDYQRAGIHSYRDFIESLASFSDEDAARVASTNPQRTSAIDTTMERMIIGYQRVDKIGGDGVEAAGQALTARMFLEAEEFKTQLTSPTRTPSPMLYCIAVMALIEWDLPRFAGFPQLIDLAKNIAMVLIAKSNHRARHTDILEHLRHALSEEMLMALASRGYGDKEDVYDKDNKDISIIHDYATMFANLSDSDISGLSDLATFPLLGIEVEISKRVRTLTPATPQIDDLTGQAGYIARSL